MKIAVVQFPGSNCERETRLAIERVGMTPVDVLWNAGESEFTQCDGSVIVGGFSYEDRVRAGLIASLDPVLKILAGQAELGKPILGICNGAQILVESGLVPGLPNNETAMALTQNKHSGFYNEWIHINNEKQSPIPMPLAHGEGRFVIEESLYEQLKAAAVEMYYYCDNKGELIDPNGADYHLAGVGNLQGNVLALMPHPERSKDGDVIFENMKQKIVSNQKQSAISIQYQPKIPALKSFQTSNLEWLTQLTITDNHAISIEMALRRLGFEISIERYTHWEIESETTMNDDSLKKLNDSFELYNPNKEQRITQSLPEAFYILVRDVDDAIGREKCQMLNNHFDLNELKSIKHGVLWKIETTQDTFEQLIQQQIFFNPYAHLGYAYDM